MPRSASTCRCGATATWCSAYVAIFVYLIAEIGVGNLFINFVSQPDIGNITHEQAAFYLTFVWGGMMVGRFAGAFIMRWMRPRRCSPRSPPARS